MHKFVPSTQKLLTLASPTRSTLFFLTQRAFLASKTSDDNAAVNSAADSTLHKETQSESKTNANKVTYSDIYVNRNPRNLEWSGHQFKRFGWNLQYPSKHFYNMCVFNVHKDCYEAYIEHHEKGRIIHMTTKDWLLEPFLLNPTHISSALGLGQVIADKCHKYGITQMVYLKGPSFNDSKVEQMFHKTLQESGLVFEEPEFKEHSQDQTPGLDYVKNDFFTDRRKVPFPPHLKRRKALFDSSKRQASDV